MPDISDKMGLKRSASSLPAITPFPLTTKHSSIIVHFLPGENGHPPLNRLGNLCSVTFSTLYFLTLAIIMLVHMFLPLGQQKIIRIFNNAYFSRNKCLQIGINSYVFIKNGEKAFKGN